MKRILYLFGTLVVLIALTAAPVLATTQSQNTAPVQPISVTPTPTPTLDMFVPIPEPTITTAVTSTVSNTETPVIVTPTPTQKPVFHDSFFFNHHKHFNRYSGISVHVTQY